MSAAPRDAPRTLIVAQSSFGDRVIETVLGETERHITVFADVRSLLSTPEHALRGALVIVVADDSVTALQSCRSLRSRGSVERVLVVLRKASVADTVEILSAGADDVVPLSIDRKELAAGFESCSGRDRARAVGSASRSVREQVPVKIPVHGGSNSRHQISIDAPATAPSGITTRSNASPATCVAARALEARNRPVRGLPRNLVPRRGRTDR